VTYTPFAHAESLRIGTVDFISPDDVKASLDIEAPDSVALNAGGARSFPRVNSYALMSVDDGYLVAQIEWLTIERAAFPKRRGVQDFGVIDLPYPLRKMSLNPVGTLRKQAGPEERYLFRRGSESLPSVGSAVLLPTEKQLRAIVESGERRLVRIGTSPLVSNAEVRIDPDRLFGRHLAVLGNTGSGKSCSVAGLIRWSLEAARSQRKDKSQPNARFIVLDPNGEYSRAFDGSGSGTKARVFKISPEAGEHALRVPLWFWNSAEWASFTQASAKTQRPLLKRALREVKAGRIGSAMSTPEEEKLALRRSLSSRLISIQTRLRVGGDKTDESRFGFFLKAMRDDLLAKETEHPGHGLAAACAAIEDALTATFKTFVDKADGKPVEYYRAFTDAQVNKVVDSLKAALETLGGIIYQQGPDEDVPIKFHGADLADHLETLGEQEKVSQFLDFLISRIRTFLSDTRIKAVIGGDDGADTLEQWLTDYLGGGDSDEGQLTIIDLSLVPTEVVHVVTAVAARMIFEALQRYRKLNKVTLPTVLVMEEAHTFVKRYKDEVEHYDASSLCCQVFERIAREGRKFGLGLVISSQRPSELSPTVLSQCNTFLLHRISNDRDQEMVHHLVPDNLRGLLRELPTLPSQNAILLGWASELPLLVRLDELPESHRPHSSDPDFWQVWTGPTASRAPNWKPVAEDWQATGVPTGTGLNGGASADGDIPL